MIQLYRAPCPRAPALGAPPASAPAPMVAPSEPTITLRRTVVAGAVLGVALAMVWVASRLARLELERNDARAQSRRLSRAWWDQVHRRSNERQRGRAARRAHLRYDTAASERRSPRRPGSF